MSEPTPPCDKNLSWLIETWLEGLRSGLEKRAPGAAHPEWRVVPALASGAAGSGAMRWFEQPLADDLPGALLVGVPAQADRPEAPVEVLLAAAGSAVLQALAESPRASAAGVVPSEAPPEGGTVFEVSLGLEALPEARLTVVASPALAQRLATLLSPEGPHPGRRPSSRTMDVLLDVELPIRISLGRSRVPLKDVLRLTTGSVLELNRALNDPVDVMVNNCIVGHGELVVVEGNYGIRIQEINDRNRRAAAGPGFGE
ncbi:MAG TPA: flagellar motor switch protein FliN [Bryobacteraceae bacterium]|nr:flagellar motor switch protein FliN [Bryobacteraceae bacterium]